MTLWLVAEFQFLQSNAGTVRSADRCEVFLATSSGLGRT